MPDTIRPTENADVARFFREVADLLEIEGANAFRIRAYRTAARTVEELPQAVADVVRRDGAQLAELPGIGKDLAGKIEEIVRTGHLGLLQQLEHQAPAGALQLMRVPGVGPRRANALSRKLGVRSVAGLARAARAHRVRGLAGFGAKTEQRIVDELSQHPLTEARTLRATAAEYAESMLEHVRQVPGVARADLAGSYRRGRETVGDIDVLVSCEHGGPVVEAFTTYPGVRQVLAHGRTRASVNLASGLQVDLRVVPAQSYGAALHYFTGSKAHNIAVRRMGQERGLKINEYGVFRGTRRIAGRTEREVYASVGLPWIPPELREDRGELDAARAGTLPRLVDMKDLRGDLQSHTTDTDGRDSLEAMANAAQGLGYEYLAVTDHTPSLAMTGGLNREGFRRQMRRIDRLNARLARLTLLKGAEVDIRADGSLDLDDATLASLDIVLVSLHAKFNLSPKEQTARLVRALKHAPVDVLAHPHGRILNGRRGAEFDLDEVLRVAAGEGKLMEVNAQPERLDLDDVSAHAAIDRGVKLTIGTDAHSVAELRFMRWGVDQARRSWATRADVANTRSLKDLLKLLHRARSR